METLNSNMHADFVQSAVTGSAAAQSAVVASWSRSMRLYGLAPDKGAPPHVLTDKELKDARAQMGSLVNTAQSALDRLYSAVGGAGCCILLADRNGVPVDRRGYVADDPVFCKMGLWTGAVWSEESEGTNGIGTAIAEQRALTIHRDQHFRSRNTALSCTVAPIFDHEGCLIAVIDVSSARSDLTDDFVRLVGMAVVEAARRVEADNFRLAFPRARIVLAQQRGETDAARDRTANALLAVDEDDLVIGASRSARHLLGLTNETLSRPLPASDLLGQHKSARQDYETAERSAIQRALARTGGNISAAAAILGISRATLHRKLKGYSLSS